MDFYEIDKEARDLLWKYHQPAILIHRPYPPQPATTRNSFFGGLPNLPAVFEWPRTTQGAAMHFLCQIDLSEIGWATELPSEGLLYFFMNESEHADWGNDETKDNCRVLYWQPSGELPPTRPTPEDIEPVQGCGVSSGCFDEAVLPGEKHRTVHVKWPIQFLKIDTFPDLAGLPDADEHIGKINENLYSEWDRIREQDARIIARIKRFLFGGPSFFARMKKLPSPPQKSVWEKYAKLLPLYRGLVLEGATGLSINPDPWVDEKRDAETLLSAGLFPWLWLDVNYFSRFMLNAMRAKFGEVEDNSTGPKPMQEMRAWLDRSLLVDQTQPLSRKDRQAFIKWLNQLRLGDESPDPARFHREIRNALMCTIRELAHDPIHFTAIPVRIRDFHAKYFATAKLEGSMIDLQPRFYFSQMLGYPSLAQSTWLANDPDVCLLNLSTDYGLGWSFADAGALTYCLPHDALAARDFDQVRGILEGG